MRLFPSEKTIKIYHFINYYRNDLSNYSKKLSQYNCTVCLDLEDSVQDLFSPENTPDLKTQARETLRKIFENNILSSSKIGIRANSFNTDEIKKDIQFLAEPAVRKKIRTILLPKTETNAEISSLLFSLDELRIEVREIIPVIETTKGFQNLKLILSGADKRLKRIAFGHCDFNKDNNLFPFFHQNSKEYWEWVKELVQTAEHYGVEFINSPFLKFNDDYAFQSMLSKLYSLCRLNFGQISLTRHQTELCFGFKFNNKQLNGFDHGVYGTDISSYAKKITEDFEAFNKTKGFSVTEKDRTLISPHEYISAKNYLSKI